MRPALLLSIALVLVSASTALAKNPKFGTVVETGKYIAKLEFDDGNTYEGRIIAARKPLPLGQKVSGIAGSALVNGELLIQWIQDEENTVARIKVTKIYNTPKKADP